MQTFSCSDCSLRALNRCKGSKRLRQSGSVYPLVKLDVAGGIAQCIQVFLGGVTIERQENAV